jgi:uncharacterized protein (DUF427 family)
MMKAVWNNQILAKSDETVVVEGNHYFPISSLKSKFFTQTEHTSYCPWKGTANYYTINVRGKENENAAWFYIEPKEKANEIKDHVAFWNGVDVTD